jgi:hypothetical protein
MKQLLGVLVVVALSSCSPDARAGETVGPSAAGPNASQRPAITPSALFSVASPQALQISNLVRFLAAFNSADINAALSLVADDIVVGDCDYAKGETVNYRGRAEVSTWLRERAADGDRIEADGFFNQSPDGNAIGVIGVQRRSGALANRGFPQGIQYAGTPKVAFRKDGLIVAFVYGSAHNCRQP